MRELSDHYEEEYLYLADVTHDAALIAWGKFFFNSKMKLIKDKKIHMLEGEHGRHTSIGANCESYGSVAVEVLDASGNVVRSVETEETYAWVSGLSPDTEYTYRVVAPEAGGTRQWGKGLLHSYDEEIEELVETDRTYACRFRTFPDPAAHEGLVFAVLGDSGTGTEDQYNVAQALEKLVSERGVRLVVMVGDTIYAKSGGSGDDDFEWLTTYFQPYRSVIDHIPFYPCMGNHDTSEGFLERLFIGEKQQDRLALFDNLLVTPRFVSELPPSREASISPGLFYRFRFGADVELIGFDTSKEEDLSVRMFEFGRHKQWVEHALDTPLGAPRWRIPFSHHPPYCKGPMHDEDETRLRHDIIPRCKAAGIRTFISGHEHNFQCIDSPSPNAGVKCFISGGAGGFRDKRPGKSTDGFMHSWGGNDSGHFLIVTINGAQMTVEPIDSTGQPLRIFDVRGSALPSSSITVER
ncbi:MAG: metallophosphoesterase [Acidobacteriota bacterium]